MNDVLARAACDFEDDTRRRQNIAKDIENEIAIRYCRRRVLAVIRHFPPIFEMASAWLTPRASASFARSSDVFIAEASRDFRSEASQGHDHASGDRLRLSPCNQ